MDFKSVFLDALISDPKISAGLMPEAFLGQTLPMADEDSLPFFKLLSCGTLKTQFPWSFDIRTLDCFLFLYTKKGRGKLLLNGQIYSLDTGNFILLDCSQRFRMDIAREPWEYVIAFFDGNPLPYRPNLQYTDFSFFRSVHGHGSPLCAVPGSKSFRNTHDF